MTHDPIGESHPASRGLARVRVRRHDPSSGAQPFFDEFDGVPFEDRSVLEVLHAIYQERDPSLAYRHVCTKGFCGSCQMVVNGVPVLACQSPAQAEMTIEPHPRFPVVRDLVVDRGWETDAGVRASHPPAPVISPASTERAPTLTGPRAQIDPDKCVHCQDCVSVCPVGVHRFVDKRVQAIDRASCLGPSCNMCVDTCWKMAIYMM
ncbi:MAG: 2Fe-2S iron-sulfur cluster-binding protein [Dehalococcoidia bacterium]|nr:2Fe-2S iron-sulfur cluster-binding protein [Dehalococcoidia bacterium]